MNKVLSNHNCLSHIYISTTISMYIRCIYVMLEINVLLLSLLVIILIHVNSNRNHNSLHLWCNHSICADCVCGWTECQPLAGLCEWLLRGMMDVEVNWCICVWCT